MVQDEAGEALRRWLVGGTDSDRAGKSRPQAARGTLPIVWPPIEAFLLRLGHGGLVLPVQDRTYVAVMKLMHMRVRPKTAALQE